MADGTYNQFQQYGGETTVNGKSHWPNSMQLVLTQDGAWRYVFELLRQLKDREIHGDKRTIELYIVGEMRVLENEE